MERRGVALSTRNFNTKLFWRQTITIPTIVSNCVPQIRKNVMTGTRSLCLHSNRLPHRLLLLTAPTEPRPLYCPEQRQMMLFFCDAYFAFSLQRTCWYRRVGFSSFTIVNRSFSPADNYGKVILFLIFQWLEIAVILPPSCQCYFFYVFLSHAECSGDQLPLQ